MLPFIAGAVIGAGTVVAVQNRKSLRERFSKGISQVKETLSNSASKVKDTVEDASSDMKKKVHDMTAEAKATKKTIAKEVK